MTKLQTVTETAGKILYLELPSADQHHIQGASGCLDLHWGWSTQESFIWERLAPRSKRLTFYASVLKEKIILHYIPSIENGTLYYTDMYMYMYLQ